MKQFTDYYFREKKKNKIKSESRPEVGWGSNLSQNRQQKFSGPQQLVSS